MGELERPCEACGGTGQRHHTDPKTWAEAQPRRCLECHGKGVLVTEEGQAVLDFVKRHLIALMSGTLTDRR